MKKTLLIVLAVITVLPVFAQYDKEKEKYKEELRKYLHLSGTNDLIYSVVDMVVKDEPMDDKDQKIYDFIKELVPDLLVSAFGDVYMEQWPYKDLRAYNRFLGSKKGRRLSGARPYILRGMVDNIDRLSNSFTQSIENIDFDSSIFDNNMYEEEHRTDDNSVAFIPPTIEPDIEVESLDVIAIKPEDDNIPFVIVEDMPEFEGGMDGFSEYIHQRLRYPDIADDIKGKVYVSFVVDEQGKVTNPEILRSPHEAFSKEVLRVMNGDLPRWKPGMQRGKNVKVKYTIPVSFAL